MEEQHSSPGTLGVRDALPQFNEGSDLRSDQLSSTTYRVGQRYDNAYRPNGSAQLAKALGWFSIGLGLAELLAPRTVARAIGVEGNENTLRAFGAREIAAGAGILAQPQQPAWMWSRVAGDALDLAALGNAARGREDASSRRRLALAMGAVAGIAVLDVLTSMQQSEQRAAEEGRFAARAVKVNKCITVNRSAEECYRFWHDFEALPRFMKHLESVQITGQNRFHWKAKAPAGMTVEWDAELTADEPNRRLAWQSIAGSVDNIGEVRFEPAPGGRGTIVRVDMQYSPPGGTAGALAAKLFGEEPEMQIDEDLRRFKWLIETGEIPTTVGQPSGPRGTMTRLLWRQGEPG